MTEHCHRPELLAPAGGREQLEAAILYGADAVYLGGNELSLRSKCQGFEGSSLKDAIRHAHASGVRIYYCLNALPFDRHMPGVEAMLEELPALGVDALIAADPGVIHLAQKRCPSLAIHLSTQAHSTNAAAVEFWKETGISRINLARELGKDALAHLIRLFPDMEFEIFVHGAMCLSLSGHCLVSAWLNGRHANLGLCTQPCRFDYKAITLTVEEGLRRDGPCLDIRQGEDFSGIWAPMDLCLVRWMQDILGMGPAALKLEGRTKSGGYVGQVTDVYRTAIDMVQTTASCGPSSMDSFVLELLHTASRPLCSGFFLPNRITENIPEDFHPSPVVARILEPAGNGAYAVQTRSPWDAHADAFLLLPGMRRPCLKAGTYTLENHRGERVDRLHPGMFGTLHALTDNLLPGIYVRA